MPRIAISPLNESAGYIKEYSIMDKPTDFNVRNEDVKKTYDTIHLIFMELATMQDERKMTVDGDELAEIRERIGLISGFSPGEVKNRLGFAEGFFSAMNILGFFSNKDTIEFFKELQYDRFVKNTYWIDNLSIKV